MINIFKLIYSYITIGVTAKKYLSKGLNFALEKIITQDIRIQIMILEKLHKINPVFVANVLCKLFENGGNKNLKKMFELKKPEILKELLGFLFSEKSEKREDTAIKIITIFPILIKELEEECFGKKIISISGKSTKNVLEKILDRLKLDLLKDGCLLKTLSSEKINALIAKCLEQGVSPYELSSIFGPEKVGEKIKSSSKKTKDSALKTLEHLRTTCSAAYQKIMAIVDEKKTREEKVFHIGAKV